MSAVPSRAHGGWGSGEMTSEADFEEAKMHQYLTLNTRKRLMSISLVKVEKERQINFQIRRRNHLNEIKICKVTQGECVSAWHQIIAAEFKCAKRGKERELHEIKW